MRSIRIPLVVLLGFSGFALFSLAGDGGVSPVAQAAVPAVAASPTPAGGRLFPETGQTVAGRFLTYWQEHGGLAQQGLPISSEFSEVNDLDNKPYTVQYFERAVFERHPANAAPFDVLLSQLGTFQYRRKYPTGAPGQQASTQNPRRFAETNHTLGGRFRTYWEAHGGLAQQGFPISEEFTEVSDLNQKPYLVQYFERAVFEYHPENAPPFDVLLSQLGTFQRRRKYPNGTPGGPATGAAIDLTAQCLLGGVQNGKWISGTLSAATLKGGETYRLYSLTTALGTGRGSAPESVGEPCEVTQQVAITPAPAAALVAVGGTWNPQPRVVRAESTDQEVYRQAAAVVLRAHGIANPQVHLTQVLRVDLEGDGEAEVLVTATYYTDGVTPHAAAGDYSVVFLRKVVAGKVETVVLAGDYYPQAVEFGASQTYRVTGVLDLNGDGVLEVLVYGEYYEGAGTSVYEIKGTHVEEVLSCGCGS
ncbi:MAG: VCBS repeat-containing protein [Chloroflexota bacterium]|nr:VCBS repeat-containing protein [Chloroflexota bacterium]